VTQEHRIANALMERLSPQQYNVLELISQGKSNTAIANQLRIHPKTAENYTSAIYRALNLVGEDQPRIKAAAMFIAKGTDPLVLQTTSNYAMAMTAVKQAKAALERAETRLRATRAALDQIEER